MLTMFYILVAIVAAITLLIDCAVIMTGTKAKHDREIDD